MEPVRPALLKLKYHHDISLGEALSWDLAVYLDRLGWHADSIIPIPLSEQRLTERGYNQVDLIARPLARLMGWQYMRGRFIVPGTLPHRLGWLVRNGGKMFWARLKQTHASWLQKQFYL